MLLANIINGLKPKAKNQKDYERVLYQISLNPKYYKVCQQYKTRFLNHYVRFMFDSAKLGEEIKNLRQDSKERLVAVYESLLRQEQSDIFTADNKLEEVALKQINDRITNEQDTWINYAKRRSHQFSQLSQSVLIDQRNHLLSSKVILMAQRAQRMDLVEELMNFQMGISPVDAFAAKLLEDTEDSGNADSSEILCFASLAEGIRNIAISQVNHFIQTRRFERDRDCNVSGSQTSEEISEHLGLDHSLIVKFDGLALNSKKDDHEMPMKVSAIKMSQSDDRPNV